ncbi:MAG: IS1182 family transposase, partial [Pseudonocardia sp.]|nr:IS1182 family transposase [Pseudonocardia sp.]
MPERPFTRDQVFVLPLALDEWIAPTHPARFVAAWLDGLTEADWAALGIDRTPARKGEARYAPAALLAIWVYGFMVGIRSTRALETACREQLPFRWLSGNQTPDHNTLARFYRRHRDAFHHLFRRSVQLAASAGLVDWALQAVDGTKIRANAAGDRMLDAAQLAALDVRVEAAIAALEAETGTARVGPPDLPAELGDPTALRARIAQAQVQLAVGPGTAPDAAPPVATATPPAGGAPLPAKLRTLTALKTRIAEARERLDEGRAKGNVTDPDAHQMTAQGVNRPAYNAQAVVAPVATTTDTGGRLIVAIAVRTRADDHDVLPDLIDAATALTGRAAAVTVADAGYYGGTDRAACAARDQPVVIPEPRQTRSADPYGPHAFVHDPGTDTLTCPEGTVLKRWGTPDLAKDARYGAPDTACRMCPAKAACCPTTKRGRVIVRSPEAAVREAHRVWMASEDAQALRQRRQGLVEGV